MPDPQGSLRLADSVTGLDSQPVCFSLFTPPGHGLHVDVNRQQQRPVEHVHEKKSANGMQPVCRLNMLLCNSCIYMIYMNLRYDLFIVQIFHLWNNVDVPLLRHNLCNTRSFASVGR